MIEFFRELGERHHLPVWATEQNDTHLGVSDRHEWSHGLKNAICLHDILVYGNVSLSVYFSFAMAKQPGFIALFAGKTGLGARLRYVETLLQFCTARLSPHR